MGLPDYLIWRRACSELLSLDHHVGVLGPAADTFQEHFANDTFDGSLTGAWNYSKELMLDHMFAWKPANVAKATRLWHSGLHQIHEYIFHVGNQYINYKVSTWLRGLITNPFFRPPSPQPNSRDIHDIKKLLEDCGIETISDSLIRKCFPDY